MQILKIILLIGIILLGVSFIQKDKLSFSKNEVAKELFQEPIQTETDKDEFKVSREGKTYTITPLFNYELYGLIVSYNNSDHWLDYHHDRWQDFINIKDICVIWGDNINSEVYKAMKFKSGSIACHATFKFRTKKEISSKFKPNCLSNNHLLSDNEKINKILKKVKTGDQIYLKGYLAEYSNDEGWYGIEGYDAKRGTSVTRTDTGNSCETIYLTDFQILKRTNAFWHYTYDFSKYLIIFCLIFGIIIFFFFDDFLRKKRFEKQKEILTIDKKKGFMKKSIIIILVFLAIIGCAGIIYATGSFDKVVGKIFTQNETEEDAENSQNNETNETNEELFECRLKFCEDQDNEDENIFCYMRIGKDYPDKISEVCSRTRDGNDCLRIFNRLTSTEFEMFTKDFLETEQPIARDTKRKSDLSGITLILGMYSSDFGKYPASKGLEKIQDENCILRENLKSMIFEMPFNPKYPKYWYGYKSDGKTYELTARLENLEDESCVIENGICLYKCKDGKCGVKE